MLPSNVLRCRLPMLLAVLLAACGDGGASGPAPHPEGPPAPSPAPLTYDFGAIPHGQQAEHDFEIAVPQPQAGLVPIAFRSGCSCAAPTFWIRSADGTMRAIDALPRPLKTLQTNDTLILRLTVNTAVKEPVDQPSHVQQAAVILQRDDNSRLEVPVVFSYAIDAPIDVEPVAHFDFGALPKSRCYQSSITLRPDADHPGVTFGAVTSSDPRIVATMTPEGDATRLDVSFRPGPDAVIGPMRALLRIPTSLGEYALNLPVSGEVVSDIEVTPFAHMSFGRIDLDQPAEQFVNLVDHDTSRAPGFEVASITDTNGTSLQDHFQVRLVPIDGDPRGTRMFLRYLGNMTGEGFRGTVTLAKPGGAAPFTEITFVGFRISR